MWYQVTLKPHWHYVNEISQTEKQVPYDLVYMWNQKKKVNKKNHT